MAAPPRRHLPCAILRDNGIPCFVWFEDAIAPYGVPTVVFDLYLLVPDLDNAARALTDSGWVDAGPNTRSFHFLTKQFPQRRLNPPGFTAPPEPKPGPPPPPSKDPPGPTTTVLLPAAEWNVAADDLRPSPPENFVPPLAILVDALIDSLLDSPPDSRVRTHVGVQVSYLYGHCAALKTQDFATNLKLEHRQFHYDALGKGRIGTVPFITEQITIREEIRQGKRQAQRNSWYLPPSKR